MPLTRSTPRISYEVHGESGPPVLLVMGFGMSGSLWRPQVDALRHTHRLVTFDHAGIGESDPPARLPTIASMANEALRLLDDLGWREAHVVGVSMGGMISQEIALAAPERVRSLTLIATHAGGLRAALPPPEGLYHFARANVSSPEGRVSALKRLLYTPDFLAKADVGALERRMHDMVGRRAPRSVVGGHLHAVLRHRTESRLARIKAPTLVVRPGRDVLVHPGNSDVLARSIPGARVVRFDDAGHGLTFQCADALNREIAAHIAEAEKKAAGGLPAAVCAPVGGRRGRRGRPFGLRACVAREARLVGCPGGLRVIALAEAVHRSAPGIHWLGAMHKGGSQ